MFPTDWYWLASDGRLYSSARQIVVTEADAAYVAWCAMGGHPTLWPRDAADAQTEVELQTTLDRHGLSVTLDDLKGKLKARVDAAAEALRLTLITPGSGQAMEYQEAFNEALQVNNAVAANAGAPLDPALYPMLSASIGFDVDPKTGQPSTDVAGEARAVLAAYDAYQRAGAAIRAARLKGKAAIEAAVSVEAAQAAHAAIAWPTLA